MEPSITHTEHPPVTAYGVITMIAMSPIELQVYNPYTDEQIPEMYVGSNMTRKNECTLMHIPMTESLSLHGQGQSSGWLL
jgi:hypothetical protein